MDWGLSDLQDVACADETVTAASALTVDHCSSRPQTSMDIRCNHGSLIHCLRASHSQDAPDLLAIGGEHSIAILQVVSRFKLRISHSVHQLAGLVRYHGYANRHLQRWV
jgi:hypothetical protein